MSITKHTILNVDEAVRRLDDQTEDPVFGKARILLREYCELLSRVEIHQKNMKPQLLNPKSAAQSAGWHQVHQLIEDISFNSLDQRLRDKLSELESQLKEEGVL